MIAKFSYTMNEAPKGYACSTCQAKDVKLWRQYNTLANHIKLLCAPCACRDQKVADDVDKNGLIRSSIPEFAARGSRTDQIGSLVPAVPTEDGDTFWGYTSVPQPGVEWWKRLPTRLEVKK